MGPRQAAQTVDGIPLDNLVKNGCSVRARKTAFLGCLEAGEAARQKMGDSSYAVARPPRKRVVSKEGKHERFSGISTVGLEVLSGGGGASFFLHSKADKSPVKCLVVRQHIRL